MVVVGVGLKDVEIGLVFLLFIVIGLLILYMVYKILYFKEDLII